MTTNKPSTESLRRELCEIEKSYPYPPERPLGGFYAVLDELEAFRGASKQQFTLLCDFDALRAERDDFKKKYESSDSLRQIIAGHNLDAKREYTLLADRFVALVDAVRGMRSPEFNEHFGERESSILDERLKDILRTAHLEDDEFEAQSLRAERDALKVELERERIRLAACGVLAQSNTPESLKRNREMESDYMSASAEDVCRAVEREMALRAERDALAARVEALEEAVGRFNACGYDINEDIARSIILGPAPEGEGSPTAHGGSANRDGGE